MEFFNNIISIENILFAWKEFLKGKRSIKDVQEFQVNLMDNIISLHNDLKTKTYTHGSYHAFNISDPKPRSIHKASVRDRLLHHAIYRVLYPHFDKRFTSDSYSCRLGKGTHRGMNRFQSFARKVSKNNTNQCYILKCDVRKFFASIDHKVLMEILKYSKLDTNTLWLLNQVVKSFHSTEYCKGLPLGNLTSQLLVNIYMNEFDQYVKHRLKVKHYIRYADDFVVLSQNKQELEDLLIHINYFLEDDLKLTLHPNKVYIKTISSGLDFLGFVHFSHHRVLRISTKKRMVKRLQNNPTKETVQSYLGLLGHGETHDLRQNLVNNF